MSVNIKLLKTLMVATQIGNNLAISLMQGLTRTLLSSGMVHVVDFTLKIPSPSTFKKVNLKKESK